jgi:Zn ribbon nucleic-acid-binding protein
MEVKTNNIVVIEKELYSLTKSINIIKIKNIIRENFVERGYPLDKLTDEFLNNEFGLIKNHIKNKIKHSHHISSRFSNEKIDLIKKLINKFPVVFFSYTTGSNNGAPRYDFVCPKCKNVDSLESRYSNEIDIIYCTNCWNFKFEYTTISKIDVSSHKQEEQFISDGIIRYISDDLFHLQYKNIFEHIQQKYPFGIESIFEFDTIVYEKDDNNNWITDNR